jgi:hypothetical protein
MSKQQATKPNQASREWNHYGFQNPNHIVNSPESHTRRCGRCERDADARENANHNYWDSKAGVWKPLKKKGVQLLPRLYPGHHENEHFENGVRYGKTNNKERGGRVSPNVPQDVVGAIGGRQ